MGARSRRGGRARSPSGLSRRPPPSRPPSNKGSMSSSRLVGVGGAWRGGSLISTLRRAPTCVDLVVHDLPRLPEVARAQCLIHAINFVPGPVACAGAVARVVKEGVVAGGEVGHEPRHRGEHIGTRGPQRGVGLAVVHGQNGVGSVAKALLQEECHALLIVDAATGWGGARV